jgi:peptidoglycan hydrolase-like protein with peptidoglycan-binding domain
MVRNGRIPFALALGTLFAGCVVAASFALLPHIAYATIDRSADGKCVPFIPQCECGFVLKDNKCQRQEGGNMRNCDCMQTDAGHVTSGTCAKSGQCLATKTSGKAPQLPNLPTPPPSPPAQPATPAPPPATGSGSAPGGAGSAPGTPPVGTGGVPPIVSPESPATPVQGTVQPDVPPGNSLEQDALNELKGIAGFDTPAAPTTPTPGDAPSTAIAPATGNTETPGNPGANTTAPSESSLTNPDCPTCLPPVTVYAPEPGTNPYASPAITPSETGAPGGINPGVPENPQSINGNGTFAPAEQTPESEDCQGVISCIGQTIANGAEKVLEAGEKAVQTVSDGLDYVFNDVLSSSADAKNIDANTCANDPNCLATRDGVASIYTPGGGGTNGPCGAADGENLCTSKNASVIASGLPLNTVVKIESGDQSTYARVADGGSFYNNPAYSGGDRLIDIPQDGAVAKAIGADGLNDVTVTPIGIYPSIGTASAVTNALNSGASLSEAEASAGATATTYGPGASGGGQPQEPAVLQQEFPDYVVSNDAEALDSNTDRPSATAPLSSTQDAISASEEAANRLADQGPGTPNPAGVVENGGPLAPVSATLQEAPAATLALIGTASSDGFPNQFATNEQLSGEPTEGAPAFQPSVESQLAGNEIADLPTGEKITADFLSAADNVPSLNAAPAGIVESGGELAPVSPTLQEAPSSAFTPVGASAEQSGLSGGFATNDSLNPSADTAQPLEPSQQQIEAGVPTPNTELASGEQVTENVQQTVDREADQSAQQTPNPSGVVESGGELAPASATLEEAQTAAFKPFESSPDGFPGGSPFASSAELSPNPSSGASFTPIDSAVPVPDTSNLPTGEALTQEFQQAADRELDHLAQSTPYPAGVVENGGELAPATPSAEQVESQVPVPEAVQTDPQQEVEKAIEALFPALAPAVETDPQQEVEATLKAEAAQVAQETADGKTFDDRLAEDAQSRSLTVIPAPEIVPLDISTTDIAAGLTSGTFTSSDLVLDNSTLLQPVEQTGEQLTQQINNEVQAEAANTTAIENALLEQRLSEAPPEIDGQRGLPAWATINPSFGSGNIENGFDSIGGITLGNLQQTANDFSPGNGLTGLDQTPAIDNPPLPEARPAEAGQLGIDLNGCGGVCEVGNTGADVKAIQQFLNDQGYSVGNSDGIYGPKTEAAVEQFQRDNDIKVDGVAGPQTVNTMNEVAQIQAQDQVDERAAQTQQATAQPGETIPTAQAETGPASPARGLDAPTGPDSQPTSVAESKPPAGDQPATPEKTYTLSNAGDLRGDFMVNPVLAAAIPDSMKADILAAHESNVSTVTFTQSQLDSIQWNALSVSQVMQAGNILSQAGYQLPAGITPFEQSGPEQLSFLQANASNVSFLRVCWTTGFCN